MNRTYSLKTLLSVMTLIAVSVLLLSGEYRTVFDETLENYGRLQIKAKNDNESGELLLQVRFTPASKGATPIVSNLMKTGQKKISEMKMGSVVDQQTGLWVVYDSSETYFTFLGLPVNATAKRQFWHNGIHIGWGRGMWAREYSDLKTRHPQLPFENLPGEMQLIYDRQ